MLCLESLPVIEIGISLNAQECKCFTWKETQQWDKLALAYVVIVLVNIRFNMQTYPKNTSPV